MALVKFYFLKRAFFSLSCVRAVNSFLESLWVSVVFWQQFRNQHQNKDSMQLMKYNKRQKGLRLTLINSISI